MTENIYKNNRKIGKICFCAGPENCDDSSCQVVKDYKKIKENSLGFERYY